MVNFNGVLSDTDSFAGFNRGFLFGDAVFETVRINNGRVLFLEDHYFRLMASLRIVRMQIPMNFTLEFFESQLLSIAKSCNYSNARVRMTVFRNGDGFYLPRERNVSFVVTGSEISSNGYSFNVGDFEVELFKDFFISANLLSTLKTNNRMLNVTASIFADENNYQSCLLLNDQKNVVEAVAGNLFMLTGNNLITPPIADGCLNGIMRKQVLGISKKLGVDVVEQSISPFELQRADELFITNVIVGIQPVTKYRKKEYSDGFARKLTEELNLEIS